MARHQLPSDIAPGEAYFSETVNTLNFASKSRQIVNLPVVNEHIGMCDSRSLLGVLIYAERQPTVVEVERKDVAGQQKRGVKRSNVTIGTRFSLRRYMKRIRPISQSDVPELDDKIEQKVSQKLQEILHRKDLLRHVPDSSRYCHNIIDGASPWLRGKNVFSEEVQNRLERLEKRLIEQQQERIQEELYAHDTHFLSLSLSVDRTYVRTRNEDDERDPYSLPPEPVVPKPPSTAMTPWTRSHIARKFVEQALPVLAYQARVQSMLISSGKRIREQQQYSRRAHDLQAG